MKPAPNPQRMPSAFTWRRAGLYTRATSAQPTAVSARAITFLTPNPSPRKRHAMIATNTGAVYSSTTETATPVSSTAYMYSR